MLLVMNAYPKVVSQSSFLNALGAVLSASDLGVIARWSGKAAEQCAKIRRWSAGNLSESETAGGVVWAAL